jgi:putative heme transporter
VTTPPDPPIVTPSAGRWYKVWRIGRYAIGLGAVVAAVWVLTGKTDELEGATNYLAHLRWWWLALALVAEAVAYLAYASLQRRLLLAGRVRVPMIPMTGISLAAYAMQCSLPGGVVFYAAYTFRQYRRFGADDVLAAWTLVAINVVSFITLSGLAAVGLAMALGNGSAFDLVEAILGIAVVSLLVVAVWTERAVLLPHAARLVKLSQRVTRWPSRSLPAEEHLDRWLDRLGAVSPGRGDWLRALTMSLANWLGDCACLAAAFLAVGAGVPWRGLLLAYGAGQLATVLPVTPGGLGVVEGSLTVALVAFGGAKTSTVAAVLLYRLISFWLVLPVGWGSWGGLLLAGRHRKPIPQAVPAGSA